MTRLGELVELNPHAERSEGPYSFIAIADIDAERAVARPRRHADGKAPNRTARPGDVLLARISPSMENGKVAIVPELETDEALVSNELIVLRPLPSVDPRLVWAFLRQQRLRDALRRFMVGTAGRLRLQSEVLEGLEIAIPDEQDWDRKARALSHLDEALRLRRQFAARIRALPAAAAAAIADGAPLAPLGEFGVELGPPATNVSREPGTIQALGAANVVDGRIDPGDARYVSPPGDADVRLQKGDLLVVRASASADRVGSCAVYEGSPSPATFTSSLLMLRGQRWDADFLWAWLQGSEARAEIRRASRQPSDRHRLTREAVMNIPVPQVEPEEETRIGELARLARRLSGIAETQIALLDRAVQAHLASTFGDGGTGGDLGLEQSPVAAEALLPHVFEVASDRQKELWRKVSSASGGFGLTDLARSDAEYAWVQDCLAIFEQLGLVVRESVDEAYRWRQPDLELEVLS